MFRVRGSKYVSDLRDEPPPTPSCPDGRTRSPSLISHTSGTFVSGLPGTGVGTLVTSHSFSFSLRWGPFTSRPVPESGTLDDHPCDLSGGKTPRHWFRGESPTDRLHESPFLQVLQTPDPRVESFLSPDSDFVLGAFGVGSRPDSRLCHPVPLPSPLLLPFLPSLSVDPLNFIHLPLYTLTDPLSFLDLGSLISFDPLA